MIPSLYLLAALLPQQVAATSQTETNERPARVAAAVDGSSSGRLATANGKELRVIRLADLATPYRLDDVPQLGPALGWVDTRMRKSSWDAALSKGSVLLAGREAPRPIDPEQLADLIRSFVEPASWEREGVSMQVSGGRLFVSHDKAVADRVAAFVDRVRLAVAPRYQIQFVCYEEAAPGTSTAPQALDGRAAKELLRALLEGDRRSVITGSGSAVLRAGGRARLGNERLVELQHDLNVEVATDARIADPRLHTIEAGTSLTCRPIVRPDGRGIALFCVFSQRAVDEIATHALGNSHMVQLELAKVAQVQSAFSVALPASGGIVFTPGGAHAPATRLLIVAERLDPVVEAGVPAIVPVGILRCEAMNELRETRVGEHRLDIDTLVEIVRGVTAQQEPSIHAGVSHLIVGGAEQTVEAARQAARFVMQDFDRSYVIELRAQSRRNHGDEWRDLGSPMQIPCLADRVAYGLSGSERAYVGDYDVEIAQKSQMSDPVVMSVFNGTQVIASLQSLGERCQVTLELLDRSVLDMRHVNPPAERCGPIQCPSIEQAAMRRVLSLAPGEQVDLGAGPARRIDGQRHDTRLTLRLLAL